MAKGGFRGGYGGGGGGGGMNQRNMMKQAQKMQEDIQRMQEQLEASSFTATAGGGAVTATVSGKHELTSLEIAPDAVDPDDVEMLQDMIIAAINEAMRKVDDASSNNMSRLTG
jgi:DNA-binding YbaB/EbfC family protein